MTRKFALPKLRIASMRPAVVVCDALGLERVAGLRAVRRDQGLRRYRVRSKACGYGVDAEPLQLLEVGAPLAQLIGFLLLLWTAAFTVIRLLPSVFLTASSTPLMNGTASSPLNVRASSSASLMTTFAGVPAR